MLYVKQLVDLIEEHWGREIDCYPPTENACQTLKSAVLAQQTNNSAMAQLLCDIKDHIDTGCIVGNSDKLYERLKVAVLTQQGQ
jgi:hypothetical protein